MPTVVIPPTVVASVPASQLAGVSGPSGAAIRAGGAPVGVSVAGMFKEVGQAVSDAAGEATVIFGPVPSGALWLLQRYVVSVENDPGSVCSLYLGEVATPNLEDGTIKGDLDVGDGDPPILVPGGERLIFHWAAADVGNVCTARIQYALASVG